MTTYTICELKDILYEAQASIFEAIRLIETYAVATNDDNARHYLLPHLRIIASREHSYLTRDTNIDDLIERLDEEGEGDKE